MSMKAAKAARAKADAFSPSDAAVRAMLAAAEERAAEKGLRGEDRVGVRVADTEVAPLSRDARQGIPLTGRRQKGQHCSRFNTSPHIAMRQGTAMRVHECVHVLRRRMFKV